MVSSLLFSTVCFAYPMQETGGLGFNISDYFTDIEVMIAGTLVLTDALKHVFKLGSNGAKILSWIIPAAAPWIGYVFGIEGFLNGFLWWHVLLASAISAIVGNKIADIGLMRGLFLLLTKKDLRAARPS